MNIRTKKTILHAHGQVGLQSAVSILAFVVKSRLLCMSFSFTFSNLRQERAYDKNDSKSSGILKLTQHYK